MKGNSKGAGFNDRLLAGNVRSMGLKHLAIILDKKFKDKDFQRQVILKIAPSLLPRLNEHTGEGGERLFPPPILNGKSIQIHNSDR